MGLGQFLSKYFLSRPASDPVKGRLPFIQMVGHEKTYGVPQPRDYNTQISNFKSWAFACAQKNGFSVAKCKLKLYKRRPSKSGGEELEEIKNHPFLDLMRVVNPFSNAFEIKSITQIFIELTGNAYWWIPKGNLRIPEMIWNIPSNWMKIVPSEQNFIEGYVMQVPGSGKAIPFSEDEICHFKFPSPFDLFYGASPLYASAYAVDLNNQIKTWGINYFMNNAQPSGVLTTDSSVTPDQYQRIRDAWNRKHRGSNNAGKIAILESGLKYQQIGTTLKDAKFEEVSREIRDEILAIFGVPASKLGLVEDVNRANADANDYTYQKETILPRLTLIEEKITEKILPMYDEGLIAKFENPVPEDRDFRLREIETAIRSGYSSIDDERTKDGLQPYNLPETQVPLIPFSMMPAGRPAPEPSPDNEPPEKAQKDLIHEKRTKKWENFINVTAPMERLFAEAMQRYFAQQHSEVVSNLNQYKSLDKVATKDVAAQILFTLEEANERLSERSTSYIKNSYIAGLNLGMMDTGHNIDLNLFEPNISRAVKERIGFFADKVNQSTLKLLRNEITQGVEAGETINDISRRVNKIFRYSEDFRSKRIAQTEVIGSTNAGQLRAYDEAGVKAKEWLTARDERVRDSHRIDGQVVAAHDTFHTNQGSNLLYPGDRSSGAPASDVINCRCTVLPVRR